MLAEQNSAIGGLTGWPLAFAIAVIAIASALSCGGSFHER